MSFLRRLGRLPAIRPRGVPEASPVTASRRGSCRRGVRRMKVDLFCHQSGHTDELCPTKLLSNTLSSCTHYCCAPVRKRVL